jgi:excisionase family DNA binding protein
MESREFTRALQARRLKELADNLCQYPPDRLQEFKRMLASPERPWMTIDEVAEQLSVHPETVRRWIRDGRLRVHRAGRQYRVTREALMEFLQHER